MMLRTTRNWSVVVGLAFALAISTPALASAHSAATTASTAPLTAHAFPSSSSTVVGSVGFIDGEQVGYFWSVASGHSVAETLTGPSKITKATLKLDVPTNALAAGAEVDWTVSINGKDVGRFRVVSGQTGPFKVAYKFTKITGGSYNVKMRVTNEVASGDGSHTLRYAGTGWHKIILKAS